MNNVSVNLENTCSGCGLCESLCPVKAIRVVEKDGVLRPRIKENCVECGKCVSSCPGRIESKLTSYKMFKHIIYGHSNNKVLRREAASGAITTELIKYLLKSDIVDFVVTADLYHNDRNLGFVIANKQNVDDLDIYSGSNYCPANIGRAIQKIKETEGRYAIVCLPCLARGIDTARKADKELDSRIKYIITLLCNHVPNYEATDYLIKRYNINSPKMIKYRGNGWFGFFRTYDHAENGTEYFSVPFSEYFVTKFSTFFWQRACIGCKDHFGIYADACMGDADFVKYRDEQGNDGETIVFSNNPELVKILQKMSDEGIISLFSDICDRELVEIYGPLSDENRAGDVNLRSRARDILRDERGNVLVKVVRRRLSGVKRRLSRIKELWK